MPWGHHRQPAPWSALTRGGSRWSLSAVARIDLGGRSSSQDDIGAPDSHGVAELAVLPRHLGNIGQQQTSAAEPRRQAARLAAGTTLIRILRRRDNRARCTLDRIHAAPRDLASTQHTTSLDATGVQQRLAGKTQQRGPSEAHRSDSGHQRQHADTSGNDRPANRKRQQQTRRQQAHDEATPTRLKRDRFRLARHAVTLASVVRPIAFVRSSNDSPGVSGKWHATS